MYEALYNASGLGLSIVMTVANRAIAASINIWNDHSDAFRRALANARRVVVVEQAFSLGGRRHRLHRASRGAFPGR